MTQRTPSKTAFSLSLFLWNLCACAVFLCLFFVSAPYGRFYTPKAKSSLWWGPAVDGRIGWTVQELASPIALLSFYHCRDEAWLFSFPNATNTTNNGGTVLVFGFLCITCTEQSCGRGEGRWGKPISRLLVSLDVFVFARKRAILKRL